MPRKRLLSIASEFSRTPGSRYRKEGDFSGEQFREELLLPCLHAALAANETVDVVLDGTAGYGTSFLEEAFGGLIREDRLTVEEVLATLHFVSHEEPYLVADIKSYVEQAGHARAEGEALP